MNGKIKTKFAALFAVALMITVCVVPMVGNDYGEAETVIVPSDGYEVAEVTISGTVKDAANPANDGLKDVKVIISGGIEDVETYTVEGGSYNGKVNLSKKSEGRTTSTITVTLDVTSDKVKPNTTEIPNPAKGLFDGNNVAIIEDVASSSYSNIDFIAGNVLVTGSVSYDNSVPYEGNDSIFLYQVVDSVYVKKYTTAMNEGAYAFSVPANSGEYCVGYGEETVNSNKVTNVQYKSAAIEITTANKSANLELVGLNAFTFKADAKSAGIPGQTTVTFTATDATLKTETVTINTDSEIEQLVEYVFAEGKTVATIKATDSNKYGTEITMSGNALTYGFNNVIAGTVVLKNASNAANSTPIANNKVSLVDANEVELLNDTTDSEGKFAIWTKGATLSGCKLETTYGQESTSIEQTTVCKGITLAVVDDSYVNVSGKVVSELTDGTKNIDLKDVEVSIAYGSTTLVVKTNESGSYNAYVPKSESVTISADTDYTYNVASYEFYAEKDTGNLNFIMDSKEVQLEFIDYDGKPLSGVTIKKYAKDKDTGEWDAGTVVSATDYKITFNGNDDLSDYFVAFTAAGRTFSNTPVAIDTIKAPIKVLDTLHQVEILDNEGEPISNLTNLSVYEAEAVVSENITIYDIESTKYRDLKYNPDTENYEFIGIISNDRVSSTKADVIVLRPSVDGYIFDDAYVMNKTGITTIQAYADVLTGTVYEADKKTVITTLGGTEVTLDLDGNSGTTNDIYTAYIKKDGSFTINSKAEITGTAKLMFEDVTDSRYTFSTEESVIDDEKKVTKYFSKEMSFAVNFNDVDGKVIEYTNGKIITNPDTGSAGSYVEKPINAEGIAVFQIPTDKKIGASLTADDGYNRSFKTLKINDSAIASKKIDFVSEQATYTVNVTDSKGAVWDDEIKVGFVVWNLNDIKDKVVTEDSIPVVFSMNNYKDGKNVCVLTVPVDGKLAVKMPTSSNSYAKYFDADVAYTFENYQVTVPAIGSFVEVTAAEANGTVVKTSLFSSVGVSEKGTNTSSLNVKADVNTNIVEYFAIDGKEYEFKVIGETPYSFGDDDVNGGKISAVDGLLLANEETVKGQVTFANGYNIVPTLNIGVLKKDGTNASVTTIGADTNGSYAAIVDVSEVVKYTATGTGLSGESATPDIVLRESYFTGAAPENATMKVALYKGDDFVKSASVTPSDGEYGFAMDVSEGDRIVMTITAGTKTFQQAIDLKAAQNDIIVPGTLVTDMTDALFADYYVISGADTAVIGSKIVLSAQKTVSVPMDIANVAYTTLVFDGWYVNGEKVSDDVNATYTVKGPCEVYAYYTEKVTETGAVADSSNDLSMDVLILGIVIVVLALLAFAYAVKFKKE